MEVKAIEELLKQQKQNEMKTTGIIIFIFLSVAASYLIGALIANDWNYSNWPWGVRAFLVGLFVVGGHIRNSK